MCSYSIDELPVTWLRVFHRLERAVGKAGLRVRVELRPLEDLPERYEILVVPTALRARADTLRSGARVFGTTREEAQTVVDEVMGEIEAGVTLYAERVAPGAPKIMVHRGPDVL